MDKRHALLLCSILLKLNSEYYGSFFITILLYFINYNSIKK